MVNHNSQTALAGEPNTIGPRGMVSQKKASRGTQGLPAVTFLVFPDSSANLAHSSSQPDLKTPR